MPTTREVLQVLAALERRLERGEDVSLRAIGELAGWSEHHLHRALRATAGETPKQYTRRRQLERAAAHLLRDPAARVADVAAACGFGSHEGFTRAFSRHFGRAPRAYREAHRGAIPSALGGACLHLYRLPLEVPMSHPPMSIDAQDVPAQPVLYMRREGVSMTEIAEALGQCLPAIFAHCQRHGVAMAGPPFARYPSAGPGTVTLEAGIPTVQPAEGDGEITAGTLGGTRAAVGLHVGPYETLPQAHAALERWVRENGGEPSGAPWESYLTDPGEVPDPAEWQTQVVLPFR
ncbi:MAG TPA: AraC family transcriptional regulator [Sandaracinaceae bacterium LLY-WYZ-13_1]|nr:AraC family transcriptional regulator [Sandaracinaceae bacterium LLY-WYZ-13_1]